MKYQALYLSSCFLFLLFSACDFNFGPSVEGQGPVIEKEIALDDFNSLTSSTYAHITLRQGVTQKIIVRGQQNILDLLQTPIRGKKLILKTSQDYQSDYPLEFEITVPNIYSVVIGGAGKVTTDGPFDLDQAFYCSLSGSGNIYMNVNAPEVRPTISGSGDIRLEGIADRQNAVISGSGNIYTDKLESKAVNAVISGSGNIKLYSSEKVTAQISGSGNITYYGSPTSVSKNVSGSGSINPG